MPDYPDYTKPITITGVTIETLPIDIEAQTIGNIAIDIAAITSTANLNIDIKAVSDTMPVSNIGTFVNPDFEEESRGWWLYGIEICIDSSQQHTGGYSLKTGSLEYATQMVSPCLRGDRVKTLSIAYRCSVSGTMKGLVQVVYGDGTADSTILSPAAADTWYVTDVTFNSAKQIIGITLFGMQDIGEYMWFDTLALSLYEVVDAVNVTVNVDITAQTVGNINIDIAAQTVGNLNVNIAASAVTLNVAIQSSAVTLDINIVSSAVTLNIKTTVGEHVDTDIVSSVTLNVDIVAQTVGNISIDIAAQTVGNINVNIAASAVTVNVDVQNAYLYIRTEAAQNLNVDIAAQTVSNLTIDIAAITTTANLNVDIKAQTVDLNIKTSGGVNLVIDKLTQAAYLEDRRTLSNNGETASWASITGNTRRGKFFPRGCRGFINTIDVYCRDTGVAGGTITVYLSPHPSMGYIASADVTVDAEQTAQWKSATFNRMWNYDSMFIFVLCSSSDIEYAYDVGDPHDSFVSTDAGATWSSAGFRDWFRAVMKAMTVGDLPVSGTLNTIEIPSLSGARQYVHITDVGAGSAKYDTAQVGAGELLIAIFSVNSTEDRDDLQPRIRCDGQDVMPIHTNFLNWHDEEITATTPGITLGVWSDALPGYVIVVTIPFPFKRSLELGFYNEAAAVRDGWVGYSFKRIT